MFDPERQRSDSDSEYALGSDVSENNDDHGADQGERRHDDASDDRKRCTGLDPDDTGRRREVEAAKRPRRDIDWERSARCRWAEAHRRPKKKRQGQEQERRRRVAPRVSPSENRRANCQEADDHDEGLGPLLRRYAPVPRRAVIGPENDNRRNGERRRAFESSRARHTCQ